MTYRCCGGLLRPLPLPPRVRRALQVASLPRRHLKKPLHTLRKEFGIQIHARYGLLAASEALRHGGVSVTARHYIENKQRSVLGFGHLLKSEERTVVPLTAKGNK